MIQFFVDPISKHPGMNVFKKSAFNRFFLVTVPDSTQTFENVEISKSKCLRFRDLVEWG